MGDPLCWAVLPHARQSAQGLPVFRDVPKPTVSLEKTPACDGQCCKEEFQGKITTDIDRLKYDCIMQHNDKQQAYRDPWKAQAIGSGRRAAQQLDFISCRSEKWNNFSTGTHQLQSEDNPSVQRRDLPAPYNLSPHFRTVVLQRLFPKQILTLTLTFLSNVPQGTPSSLVATRGFWGL